jgi:1-phosphofructokinase family hexose kinase
MPFAIWAATTGLGFIGGHNSQIMVDLLKKEGVTCYFTQIAQETRRNLIIGTRGRGTQTMLNSRGPSVTQEEWKSFLTHVRLLDLRDSYVVLSGSLPRGVPIDAYRQIITLVQSRGAKAVLDTDGPTLKIGLAARPFAIKPNLNELRRLTGMVLRSERTILSAASRLHRAGVKIVLFSMAQQGLMMISATCCCRAIPPGCPGTDHRGRRRFRRGRVRLHPCGREVVGGLRAVCHRCRHGHEVGAGQPTLPIARCASLSSA